MLRGNKLRYWTLGVGLWDNDEGQSAPQCDAPGAAACLDRGGNLHRRNIHERDGIAGSVGDDGAGSVRGYGKVPRAVADLDVAAHRAGGNVDDGGAVGASKSDNRGLA